MMRTGSGANSFKPISGDTLPADGDDTDADSDSAEDDLQNRAAPLGTFGALNLDRRRPCPRHGRKSIVLLSEGFKMQTRTDGVDTLNGRLTDPLRRHLYGGPARPRHPLPLRCRKRQSPPR